MHAWALCSSSKPGRLNIKNLQSECKEVEMRMQRFSWHGARAEGCQDTPMQPGVLPNSWKAIKVNTNDGLLLGLSYV